MSKLTLNPADSVAVRQYLEKAIGVRGVSEINRVLGPLMADVPLLIGKLISFESLYPGIVGSVVVFIIGLLTNKDPIHKKLNDPSFVEAERNRFRNEVVGEKEPVTQAPGLNSIDELYETLTTFFTKISKSVPSDADGL